MAKKKHAEEHVNLERWLISYADFITLLFATFVVLYALSQIDLAKFKDLKISLAKAFSSAPTIMEGDAGVMSDKTNSVMDTGGQMDNQNLIPPLLDQPYAKEENSDFQKAMDTLNNKDGGKAAKTGDGIKAEITERGLVINIIGNVLFDSSSSKIKKESYKALNEIGKTIKTEFPNHIIRVEGHTDNLPMSSAMYPSNWELSSARASSIVRYLISSFGLPEDRFSALGYGDSRPIAPNNTEEGRKKNRRVEIVILKNNSLKTEVLTKEFKKDLKAEIEEFKKVTQSENKNYSTTSDAVKNLLKDTKDGGQVVIINNADDAYRKDAQKILEELKAKEQQNEADMKLRTQEFAKGIKKKQ